MLYVLYVALVIALPAALGAQMVARNINRKDPSAGFMLLLLAAVPAFGFAFFAPQGIIAPFRFDMGGPGAYGLGVMIGATVGAFQRWMPQRA